MLSRKNSKIFPVCNDSDVDPKILDATLTNTCLDLPQPTKDNVIIHSLADTDDVTPMPKDGIPLSYIINNIVNLFGRHNLEGLTTSTVNENFIIPETNITKLSYCEYLRSNNCSLVDTAQVFISHAWNNLFLDVIDALSNHFQSTPDIIIWFDLFSNNQHKAIDLDFHWWCNTFKSAIEALGHTVMVSYITYTYLFLYNYNVL
jgi:hypothetical protein